MWPTWSSSWLRAPKYMRSRSSTRAKMLRRTETRGSRACPAVRHALRKVTGAGTRAGLTAFLGDRPRGEQGEVAGRAAAGRHLPQGRPLGRAQLDGVGAAGAERAPGRPVHRVR